MTRPFAFTMAVCIDIKSVHSDAGRIATDIPTHFSAMVSNVSAGSEPFISAPRKSSCSLRNLHSGSATTPCLSRIVSRGTAVWAMILSRTWCPRRRSGRKMRLEFRHGGPSRWTTTIPLSEHPNVEQKNRTIHRRCALGRGWPLIVGTLTEPMIAQMALVPTKRHRGATVVDSAL